MRLILARHGQTEENLKKINQSHLPGKLTKLGIGQAKKLASRLKTEHFDAIYSSDLARAADTAQIIAKHHPDTELVFTQSLREYYTGAFMGKKSSEVDWSDPPDDAETAQELYDRAKEFLEWLVEKHKDKSVLCVAHSGINLAIMAVIRKENPDRIWDMTRMKNTAISIFELHEEGHRIILDNCTDHLSS